MKIIIYGINFKPEMVGIGKFSGELADFLGEKDHEIKVITAPKYYPEWRVKKNSFFIEKTTNYRIYRCPIYVPKSPNGIKRIIHLISFSLSSFPNLIRNLMWKADLIILITPTLFCAINVFIYKLISFNRVLTMIHIQDFELEAAFNLKILKGKLLKNLFSKVESFIFKNFSIVCTISKGMLKKLIDKGVNEKRIYYFPNWVDINDFKKKNFQDKYFNRYRQNLNIPPEKVIIQYSGTMNKKQGFDFLIPIIEKFKDEENILWIFGGAGPSKKKLISDTNNISNIMFLPFQDAKDIGEWLNLGDIHIIPQEEKVEDLLFPSKLLGILASGSPIISNTSSTSDLGKIVEKAGIRVDPKDKNGFINALNLLINDEKYRIALGREGRAIAEKKFNKKIVLQKFENFLLSL